MNVPATMNETAQRTFRPFMVVSFLFTKDRETDDGSLTTKCTTGTRDSKCGTRAPWARFLEHTANRRTTLDDSPHNRYTR